MAFATNRFTAPYSGVKLVADNGSAGGYVLSTDLVNLVASATLPLVITSGAVSINLVTPTTAGSVPASGGGTTNFLRADLTWAAPPASGGSTVTPVIIDGSTIPGSVSTPYVMQPADRFIYVNKTTGAATSITLPSSPVLGVTYDIKDGKNDAATNNITITAPNGGTIDGASTLVIASNRSARGIKAVTATLWALV